MFICQCIAPVDALRTTRSSSPPPLHTVLTIYAPMIYTAPCVIFLIRADALRGEVGLSEIARADRRVQFWAHFPT